MKLKKSKKNENNCGKLLQEIKRDRLFGCRPIKSARGRQETATATESEKNVGALMSNRNLIEHLATLIIK